MYILENFKRYYCLDNTFIGKNVNTVKELYPLYCSLFGVEPIEDIIKEICQHYSLSVKNNKFVDCKPLLAKYGY